MRRGQIEGSAFEAAVAWQVASEAECGQPRQHRQDACSAIEVGGLQLAIAWQIRRGRD
jgi:hypothetical protein